MLFKGINLIRTFLKIEIVKVFSLTAISSIVKMLTAFVTIKFISNLLGPSGVALIGQLNNFISITIAFASVGISQGVTRFVSENKKNKFLLKKYIGTAFLMTLISSLICGVLLLLFNSYLSLKILETKDYGFVFIIFGFGVLFYTINNLLLSIINGFQNYNKFIKINIISSLLSLSFTIILVYFLKLKGALISLVLYQSIVFFITYYLFRKNYWKVFLNIKEKLSKDIIKKYFHYSLMAISTAATVPFAQLYLRSYIISNISIKEAGLWEGMNKLSGMYLLIITTSLSVYYLPKLSELKTNFELRNEIFKVYKLILPFLTIGLLIIFFLKKYIILILFTEDFLSMTSLFFYQLFGDFFKIASWILAFNMIAKSMTKTFVLTEISINILYVFLSIMFINYKGIIGITQAYLITYIVYFIIMLIVFRKLVFKPKLFN